MVLQYLRQDDQDGQVIDDPADPALQQLQMARRDSKHFTVTELNIIKPFRAKFRDIPGFEYQERAAYLRKHVFPPLLSHWYRNPETKHRTNNTNIDIWTDVCDPLPPDGVYLADTPSENCSLYKCQLEVQDTTVQTPNPLIDYL